MAALSGTDHGPQGVGASAGECEQGLLVSLSLAALALVVGRSRGPRIRRFKRLITAHELHLFFAPSREEVEWAAARTDCDEHVLAQLALKSYQRTPPS
ncbi:hypothetical protein [Streptomyces sp. NPDC017890]|uniref:hypothetical protein n=1 Tax=Streptomyces sp. NPDC017890 TaxID=3365015 RepID=UPI0037B14360